MKIVIFKKILLIVITFSLILSQEQYLDNEALTDTLNQNKRFNLSLGFLDSRTGLSLIGLSYDIYQDSRNEIFIGGGTALIAFTGSLGWKHYFSDTYNNNINIFFEDNSQNKFKFNFFSSPFLVVSYQAVAHLGFAGFAATFSPGYEIRFSKYISTQLGCNFMMLMSDREPEFGFFPFWNMDIHF